MTLGIVPPRVIARRNKPVRNSAIIIKENV